MSKQKLLYYIETQLFELIQQLSIFVYVTTLKNKHFNFEKYIDTTLDNNITKTLDLLNIKDTSLYKNIFYKYLLIIYNMSKQNAINYLKFDISNKKILFDYWYNNKKIFIKEILDIYTKEQ